MLYNSRLKKGVFVAKVILKGANMGKLQYLVKEKNSYPRYSSFSKQEAVSIMKKLNNTMRAYDWGSRYHIEKTLKNKV